MKSVVSQQSAVGSQQSVDIFFAPAQSFKKIRNAIGSVFKLIAITIAFIVQSYSVLAQNNNDTNVKNMKAQGQYQIYETTYNKSADTASKTSPVEMATGLRSNGKIYVVVAVLVIILAGLIFYLVRLDRKITRLEKEGSN